MAAITVLTFLLVLFIFLYSAISLRSQVQLKVEGDPFARNGVRGPDPSYRIPDGGSLSSIF